METEEQKDDGVRFKCNVCCSYIPVEDVDKGVKCDLCEQWFILCGDCTPDHIPVQAVWLCPECR